MTESILNTIKKMLGISVEDTSFDPDIIVHINAALMALNQLGVGPESPFSIADASAKWEDMFLTDLTLYLASVPYIYTSVRLLFDPPSNSFVIEALERQRRELEFRLIAQVPIPPEPAP